LTVLQITFKLRTLASFIILFHMFFLLRMFFLYFICFLTSYVFLLRMFFNFVCYFTSYVILLHFICFFICFFYSIKTQSRIILSKVQDLYLRYGIFRARAYPPRGVPSPSPSPAPLPSARDAAAATHAFAPTRVRSAAHDSGGAGQADGARARGVGAARADGVRGTVGRRER
jgi:hypothetical protein